MNRLSCILLFIVFQVSAGYTQSLNLMPLPESIEVGKGQFRIDRNFTIGFTNGSERIIQYADRILIRIDRKSGTFIEQHQLNELDTN